jgi:hypothetical protein
MFFASFVCLCVSACNGLLLQESFDVLASEETRRYYDWTVMRDNQPPGTYIWPFEADPSQRIINGTPPRPVSYFAYLFIQTSSSTFFFSYISVSAACFLHLPQFVYGFVFWDSLTCSLLPPLQTSFFFII